MVYPETLNAPEPPNARVAVKFGLRTSPDVKLPIFTDVFGVFPVVTGRRRKCLEVLESGELVGRVATRFTS
jgi:hypothetical protein